MEADFSGYATKAGIKCTDGRTIMPDAFKAQHQHRVPLIWQHDHKDPDSVLGHAILENREDGMYAYGFFNDTTKAQQTKSLVEHGDINSLSIWANDLIERSGRVLHGAIREVSLVMSGANSGARIENVSIRHSDGAVDILDDEAIIYSDLPLIHADDGYDDEEDDDEEDDDEETISDVYESMTDKQKKVLQYMVGVAIENSSEEDDTAEHSAKGDNNKMIKHNVFESGAHTGAPSSIALSHTEMEGIFSDAMRVGSLRNAVESYALSHGINDIDLLFPDAVAIDKVPEWEKRRTEWVAGLLSGVRKSPFNRIKSLHADITADEARAKGYIKGNEKLEEFFTLAKRETTPQTVYKKQKLDRDDLIDITDFDVISWMKAELRLMLDEEIGRAILIGDGREIQDVDKIKADKIRPIVSDDDLYTIKLNVNLGDSDSSIQEAIDELILNRRFYKGTGSPNFYTTEKYIAKFLLLKDGLGRRIYKSLDELASELRVSAIIPVEVLESVPNLIGIMVNPSDYVVGATAGGQVSMFDDFDIDFNQHKYLIETRMCGALVKLHAAIAIFDTADEKTIVEPTEPSFDGTDVVINDTVGVVYKNEDSKVVLTNAGSPYTLGSGQSIDIVAIPDEGYVFSPNADRRWTFENTN